MADELREVVDGWKKWHRQLCLALPSLKVVERNATLQEVKRLARLHDELLEVARGVVAAWKGAHTRAACPPGCYVCKAESVLKKAEEQRT